MKKTNLLLSIICITLLTFSCSKDDDRVPVASNIIGTWNLDYYIDSGTLHEEIICDELVQYIFLSNGNYSETTFAGDTTSDCVTAVVINGTWENTSGTNYDLTPNAGNSGSTLSITFQDDFRKFTSNVSATRTEVFAKQ